MIALTWNSVVLWLIVALPSVLAAAVVVFHLREHRLADLPPTPAPEPVFILGPRGKSARRRSHVTAGVGLVEFDVAEPLRLDLKKIQALIADLAEARNNAWPDERPLIVMPGAWPERSAGWDAWARPVTPDEARVAPESGS